MTTYLTSTGFKFADNTEQKSLSAYSNGSRGQGSSGQLSYLFWNSITYLDGTNTATTLPALSQAQVGDEISILNSTPGNAIRIYAPSGSSIIAADGATTAYFDLPYMGRFRIAKWDDTRYLLLGFEIARPPFYNTVNYTFSYNNWFVAPTDGVATMRFRGAYMNGARIYAGPSTGEYYHIGQIGNDYNNNTWAYSFTLPVVVGTHIYVEQGGWIPHGFEEIYLNFYVSPKE
jgi:hypothetical protein